MIYEDKKWKNKIAFDNNAYKEIKRYSFNLDDDSKKILDKEIEFYRHNFSILQVMEVFDTLSKSDKAHFKDVVTKRVNGLLFCPTPLKQYFVDIIKSKYNDDKEFFMFLLTTATNKKSKNVVIPLYKAILGKYYADVKHEVVKYSKRKYIDTPNNKVKNPEETISRLESNIQNDRLLQGIWGDIDDTQNVITYEKTSGFGRLDSHHFNGTAVDFITLHTLGNNVEYQYYRNVYPGKAHLYNTVFLNQTQNIDLGSRWILNGWAMFSSLHARKSIYTKNAKILSANILRPLLTIKNYNTAIEQSYIYMLTKMPRQQAFNNLLYLTQKVGAVESYVLGGIATELVIKSGWATSPMDLLRKYRKVNLGDFFALFRKSY